MIVLVLAGIVGGGILWGLRGQEEPLGEFPQIKSPEKTEDGKIDTADQFRNQTINFVRKVAENYFDGEVIEYPEELEIKGNWELQIIIYYQGEIKGEGIGKDETLSLALEEATKIALSDKRAQKLTKINLKEAKILVKFFYPPNQFSFIESNGEGKELITDLVAIREVDKELIGQKIEQGKEFLYRMMDEEEYGFHKKYDVLNDDFENRLHTVYSASIIYTFLYIYDLEGDKEILEHLADWGNFLLSMQNKNKEDERYGAFHYSFYLDSKEREKKFVVGTSALSIFTLLRLYNVTDDSRYLESAKLAGNWLTTMQEPDGSMKAYLKYSNGEWVYGTKESLLYNGQVLSALSKLYRATGDKKYYDTAKRIAQRFREKYEKEKGYIQGEYRSKNPISNSWVVMSLMDFYKAEDNILDKAGYKNIIFELSEKILENQQKNTDDLLYHGGWAGAYSTSGTGWISEVMAETYRFCNKERGEDCDKYKDSVIKAIRWLIQNTYSEENTFFLKNPEKAIGGVFWNGLHKYVRTDSVCHALNSYVIIIMNYLGDGLLLSIPEESLEVILNELKKL